MTPKLSPQALQFGKSDGAGSPIYLKKQVPSGPAWKTPKVIQSGEWGSYRDQNHHFEGPGFMEVTAQRMGAAAGSQVWTTGRASGRGASGRGPAEPAGGGLPPAQGLGRGRGGELDAALTAGRPQPQRCAVEQQALHRAFIRDTAKYLRNLQRN